MSNYSYFNDHGECVLARQNGREVPTPDGLREYEGFWPGHWLINGVPVPEQDWTPGLEGRRLTGLPAGARVRIAQVVHTVEGSTFEVPGDPYTTVEVIASGYARKRLTVI